MKKSGWAIVLLVLILFGFYNTSVGETYTSELWQYVPNATQGTCKIVGYLGTANDGTDVECPVTINGYQVTSFDKQVFRGMTFLTSVVLPDATEELGDELFYGCSSLVSVNLGKNSTALPRQIFFGDRSLTSVTLPSLLETVGEYVFGNCTTIPQISLPNSVRQINSRAFYNCSNLTTLVLPSGLVSIGNGAFYGCNRLVSIELPDSLTSLGTDTFKGCNALESVTIGTGLATIDSTTFSGLQSLKTLTLNTTNVVISSGAFQNCTALQTVEIDSAYINASAFSYDSGLKSFSMSSGEISGAAFSGCSLLETVYLGSGVTSIPSNAFSNLSSLKTVTIDENSPITTIPYQAFQNDSALESLSLPPTITGIGSYAFSGCSSLKNFSFPANLSNISESAFQGCSSLDTVTLPAGITHIQNSAFSNCTGITEISFLGSVQSIGEYSFSGCLGLTNIVIPNGMESIGANAFIGCSDLATITLSNTVQTVGRHAFPTATKVYCNPSSAAAISISQNGGCFVSPDNPTFGIRWLLDDTIILGLSVEQIWTESDTIVFPETIGGESVTEIGMSALASCPTVTNVTFPASVPILPDYLCGNNNRIIEITIPNGVTNIGEGTFANCTKLARVNLPDTLTRIGAYAFDGCSLLNTINLPDNITYIGTDAFSSTKVFSSLSSDTAKMLSRTGGGFVCNDYPELTLKYLFEGGIPVSLEVISADPNAVSVTIPDSVSRIGEHAFENNTVLTTISIPESVTEIGQYAFAGSSIESVILPEGVTVIPPYAFYNTASMTSFSAEGVISEIGYNSFRGSGVVELSFSNGLTKVGNSAFRNMPNLLSCILPDSVQTIGSYAFENDVNLSSFAVPADVTIIESYTFQNTLLLESVVFPSGLTSIGDNAFYKSGISSIEIPSSVQTLGHYSFSNSTGLKNVVMSGNMSSIGDYAFYYCINLEKVAMPDTLQTIGNYAFQNCHKLKEIVLPASLNSVSSYAFSGCSSLTHVRVGDGTVEIKEGAFYYCRNLKSVEFPNTLAKIGEYTFYYSGLTSVTLPESITTIDQYAFYYCNDLVSVSLPNSLTVLGDYAFSNCSNLKQIQLSNKLISIPPYAFSYCQTLSSFEIPDGVRTISDYAFGENTNLSAVAIPQSITSIGDLAFGYTEPSQLTVYCIQGSTADTFASGKGYNVVYLSGNNAYNIVEITPKNSDIFISPGQKLQNLVDYFDITPKNIPGNINLVFSTDNQTVADITINNELDGISIGDTVLQVSVQANASINSSIPVHVRNPLNNLSFANPIWLHRNNTLPLYSIISSPSGVTDGINWEIDRVLGSIDDSVFTPTAFGSGILSGTSWDGSASYASDIHIYDDPTEITMKVVDSNGNPAAGMDIGMSLFLEPTVKAGAVFTDNLALHFITYTSSDVSVATVNQSGVVTATGYGDAVITATASNGCTGTADIHVSEPITSFKLRGNQRLPIGVTVDMDVIDIVPSTANMHAFSWKVEPEGLAEYHNGKVTVLTDQECEVTITATAWNDPNNSESTDLYIYRPDVESIEIQDVNQWNWIEQGKDIQLTALVKATNLFTNQLITWSVDENYSGNYINENGVLHADYGSVRVIAKADNGIQAEKTFYAAYPTTSFTVEDRYAIQTGDSVTVYPVNQNECEYTLMVGNDDLVSVNDMTITGLKPGRTQLTVTSWNGVVSTAEILVYDPIQKINISAIDSLNNKVSASDPMHHIFATMNFQAHSDAISDRTYTDDLVTWTTSNPSVIRITDGRTGAFRTVSFGDATLTATAKNGVKGSIDLHVFKEVDNFTLPNKITAYVLSDTQLSVQEYRPSDAYDGFVWEVSPPTLGHIEGQILHVDASQPTNGTITATSWDGFITKQTDLEIISSPVTAVSFDEHDSILEIGGVYPMTVHVTAGTEYVNTFLNWSSSDESIATVDEDGKVYPLAEGTVTITATALDDPTISDSAVFECITGVESFTVPDSITLYPDESYAISASDILPVSATDRPFIYTSSNEQVVTVKDGIIKPVGRKAGSAVITVSSWNGVILITSNDVKLLLDMSHFCYA